MAVIVANIYQQASMCTNEKRQAPRWLIKFSLVFMAQILRMRDKVEAVLNQKVSFYF